MFYLNKYVNFINLSLRPSILNYKLIKSINNIIKNSDFVMGSSVYKLEELLKKLTNTKYVITCSNGTDALLLALMSLNIKKNDTVFLPSFTFTSTAESVALLGAIPFFIDVIEETFNLDPFDLEKGIILSKKNNNNIKAIITVDMFGQPSNFDEINAISNKYNIPLIIDAAQSLGAIYKKKSVGSIGFITTTSFFPTKPLGGFGDGGAIFTNNKKTYKKILSLRNHGAGNNKYENIAIGLNARLDTIQASMLIEKIKFLKKEFNMRKSIANFYNKNLKKFFFTPNVLKNTESVWAQYTLKLKNKIIRNKVHEYLNKNLIETRIYYKIPLHLQKIYKNYPKTNENLYKSENLSEISLSLPIYPYMQKKIKNKIILILTKAIKNINYK